MIQEIQNLERKIRGGMMGIKNKTKTPQEAGLGAFFNKLRTMDEALYEKLISEYKDILTKMK